MYIYPIFSFSATNALKCHVVCVWVCVHIIGGAAVEMKK